MVHIERGNNKITIEATTKRVPKMFGHKKKQYMTGKTFVSYISKVVELDVNVSIMSDADYNKFEKMLFDKSNVEEFTIIAEDKREYNMVFSDDSISLTDQEDDEGNTFWTGILKFTQ